MRHIALVGLSFCGSTIVSYALGSLPGAATIGESHWIVDAAPDQLEGYCTRCKRNCQALTQEFLGSLRKDQSQWYDRIGRALGTDILISSDKTFDYLEVYAPSGDYDALILFKLPERHAESYAREARIINVEPNFEQYFNYWATSYKQAVEKTAGKSRLLFLDDFLANPTGILHALSEWIGSGFDENAVRYWEHPHHAIGGNFSPWGRLASAPDSLPIHAARYPAPPADEITEAIGNTQAWDVFEWMMASRNRISA